MLKYHVLKNLSLDQVNIIRYKMKEWIINDVSNKNFHILFRIIKDENKFTFFHNGTCLIQGKKIQQGINLIYNLLSLNYLDKNQLNNNNKINNNVNIIGSDEVGTGDVFGPIIVCSLFLSSKNIFFFQKMNVNDSKKLSSQNIFKITRIILDKRIPYILKILHPAEYNLLIKKKYNLNKIKALLHNEAILQLIKKIDKKDKICVVVDQFASSQNYFNYLKEEKSVYKEIIFETKSESKYLSVALASILARYFFLEEMKKLSKKINIILKFGASAQVDKQLSEIIKKRGGFVLLNEIAKCNFKNVQKILNNKLI
ncbi:ribonuclease HIII [Candidatus Phytoplasma oryzae]|nr:ribonuclease HIII [Candidatus Phytoplasma oryzae]